MRLPVWAVPILGSAVAVFGCSSEPLSPRAQEQPSLTQAPAEGNVNKQVITLNDDVPEPFVCPGGQELNLHVEGWIQLRFFRSPDNPRVELDVFHVVHTWSNTSGDTFVDQEILAERYYIDRDTGHLILAFTGKLSFLGVIGQLVIDLNTDEVVFVTGPGFPDHLAQACAALT
jgi:hypothetical protein